MNNYNPNVPYNYQGSADLMMNPGAAYPPMNQGMAYPQATQPFAPPSQPGVIVVDKNVQAATLPRDASFAEYSTKVCCPKCGHCGMTNMTSQAGTAAWVWCILLFPVALTGLCCLCLDSCKDKIHMCTRCGTVVGKKHKNVC